MADFIPLVTYDYKLAFCRATNILPKDVQQIIWQKALEISPIPPPTPTKPSPRLTRLMDNWKKRQLKF